MTVTGTEKRSTDELPAAGQRESSGQPFCIYVPTCSVVGAKTSRDSERAKGQSLHAQGQGRGRQQAGADGARAGAGRGRGRWLLCPGAGSAVRSEQCQGQLQHKDQDIGFSKSDLAMIRKVGGLHDPTTNHQRSFEYLVASLCPEIVGNHAVKAGLLLAIAGGTRRETRLIQIRLP